MGGTIKALLRATGFDSLGASCEWQQRAFQNCPPNERGSGAFIFWVPLPFGGKLSPVILAAPHLGGDTGPVGFLSFRDCELELGCCQ